ncbi:hypothetical protein OSB04_025144 [Centaurea solstitialis]|uniref:Reverse transcriptase zinc-binding domain-containing protein n=1 Tax=Centaurea solstitialis TaxID=347529 RepID=A0AA38W1F3_9ASTR|nr:hypothetical protein OSB04_025144 [Centaurea solstitialis]
MVGEGVEGRWVHRVFDLDVAGEDIAGEDVVGDIADGGGEELDFIFNNGGEKTMMMREREKKNRKKRKRKNNNEVDKGASVLERGELVGEEWRWKWVAWKLDPNGDFSVGALRDLMKEMGERRGSNGPKISWLKSVPKKICIFIWRPMLGRLPVRVELDRKGVDLDSVLCPRCRSMEKSVQHTFF